MQIAKWRLLAWCAVVWLGPSIPAGGLSAASAATNEQMVADAGDCYGDCRRADLLLRRLGTATPLRVASAGTTLRVLSAAGEWTQVQFQDPQFGLRTVGNRQADTPGPTGSGADDPGRPRKRPGHLRRHQQQHQLRHHRRRGCTQAVPSDDEGPRREGAWFNIGFGFGSLGCEDCAVRDTGGSG